MLDLARRAVACSGWRWVPGMTVLALDPREELNENFWLGADFRSGGGGTDDAGPWVGVAGDPDDVWRLRDDGRWDLCCYIHGDLDRWGVAGSADLLPDLTDPATLGCLLALVREAWGDETIHVRPHGREWRCYRAVNALAENGLGGWLRSEAAALVAALEAAP